MGNLRLTSAISVLLVFQVSVAFWFLSSSTADFLTTFFIAFQWTGVLAKHCEIQPALTLPSLPSLNLNLGGGCGSGGGGGAEEEEEEYEVHSESQGSHSSYPYYPQSSCYRPPPPPPCPPPPHVSVLPVPPPPPVHFPEPSPSEMVTIPNIIVALLPPTNKPGKKHHKKPRCSRPPYPPPCYQSRHCSPCGY